MSISAIISTHARPALLREAVESVRMQRHLPIELLVVDDVGDTDTRQVLDSLRPSCDFPVVHIVHQGSGASSSRNRGAFAAQGEWIAFLDDDDWWDREYLEAVHRAGLNSAAEVVVTQLRNVRDGVSLPVRVIQPGLIASEVIARNPGVTGSSVVITATAFNKLGGFDETLWVSNDKDFFYRTRRAGIEYELVTAPLVNKREHHTVRLTDHDGRRVAGFRAYYHKHRADMSPADRRHIRAMIAKTEMRRDQHPLRRAWAAVRLVGLGSAWERADRRLQAQPLHAIGAGS